MSDRLKEMQAYYRYPQSAGWAYLCPPALDPSLQERLVEIGGKDERGDPVYAFIWAGVALERKEAFEPDARVYGDRRAVHYVNGRLMPRFLHVKTRQLDCHCYLQDGHVVRVERRDQVPTGVFSWVEYKYTDFGKLLWFLGRKLTPAQLISAGVYAGEDPDLPREGEYYCLRTVGDGSLYLEPDEKWIQAIALSEHERFTGNLKQLSRRDALEGLKIENEKEARQDGALAEYVDGITENLIEQYRREANHALPTQ